MNTYTRYDSLKRNDSADHTSNFQDEILVLRRAVKEAENRIAELEDDLEFVNRALVLRDQMIESLAG